LFAAAVRRANFMIALGATVANGIAPFLETSYENVRVNNRVVLFGISRA
jgi:hypothetical protein